MKTSVGIIFVSLFSLILISCGFERSKITITNSTSSVVTVRVTIKTDQTNEEIMFTKVLVMGEAEEFYYYYGRGIEYSEPGANLEVLVNDQTNSSTLYSFSERVNSMDNKCRIFEQPPGTYQHELYN